MIDIVPLTAHVGAEVRGLDLRQAVDEATARRIYAAWLRHSVLIVRGQTLSAEDQLRFTRLFGEIQPPRSRAGERDPDNPAMYIANTMVDGQRGELPEGDMQFHADQCYYENPAKGAVLYGMAVPSSGGNTLFSSAHAAYEGLSPARRAQADKADVLFLYDYEKNANRRAPTDWAGAPRHVHPAVTLHPETARPALLVNRLMADSVIGLDKQASDDLIETLCDAAERPEIIYEHIWQVGDVVIWDNRAVFHARTDFAPGESRILRRLALKGEKPIRLPSNE